VTSAPLVFAADDEWVNDVLRAVRTGLVLVLRVVMQPIVFAGDGSRALCWCGRCSCECSQIEVRADETNERFAAAPE